MDWMGLNGDKLVVGIEEDEDELEEEVKSKLDMRGEGIRRNDQRGLHRRDSWMDGHVLSRYMIRRKEEGGKRKAEEEPALIRQFLCSIHCNASKM
jgi:hypothetical protein